MIHVFIGTKPEYVKMAPLLERMAREGVDYRLIDSGQHAELVAAFRREFGLRDPDMQLGRGRDVKTVPQALLWLLSLMRHYVLGSRLRGRVFGGHGGVCVVHGDTPTTLAGALLARRAGLSLAHVEAGLRTFHWLHPFPEEIVRVAVGRLADVLFAPGPAAAANLRSTGVKGRIVEQPANTLVESVRAILNQSAGGAGAGSEAVAGLSGGVGPVVGSAGGGAVAGLSGGVGPRADDTGGARSEAGAGLSGGALASAEDVGAAIEGSRAGAGLLDGAAGGGAGMRGGGEAGLSAVAGVSGDAGPVVPGRLSGGAGPVVGSAGGGAGAGVSGGAGPVVGSAGGGCGAGPVVPGRLSGGVGPVVGSAAGGAGAGLSGGVGPVVGSAAGGAGAGVSGGAGPRAADGLRGGGGPPAIVTMHRVENLHLRVRREALVDVLCGVAASTPVRWVMHGPTERILAGRTRQRLVSAGVELVPQASHHDFLGMLAAAPFAITDGGSIQEECAMLGVPVLLWRDRTDRGDGLGDNAVLSHYDEAVVADFLRDPGRHRRPHRVPEVSPTAEILDELGEWR